MSTLAFVDACSDEHFRAMSLIHALGWRDTYRGYVPDDYMAREITGYDDAEDILAALAAGALCVSSSEDSLWEV